MNNDQTTPANNDTGQPDSNNPQAGLGLGANPAGQPPSTAPDQNDAPGPTPPIDIAEPKTEDNGSKSGEDNINPELEDIRKDALTKLTPLVGKLDQPPEERFHTLMMVIQASDDQSLIKQAFDAANQIDDEAKKAEALLGIVNEINYFAKKGQDSPKI
jgi:hypothetical protein